MSVTPIELLQYAQALPCGTEVDARAVVNRSYYAAYHVVKGFHDALAAPGCLPNKPTGVHESLYHQMTNPTINDDCVKKLSKQLGYIARDLKEYRRIADYELDRPLSADDAEYVIENTKKLMALAGVNDCT